MSDYVDFFAFHWIFNTYIAKEKFFLFIWNLFRCCISQISEQLIILRQIDVQIVWLIFFVGKDSYQLIKSYRFVALEFFLRDRFFHLFRATVCFKIPRVRLFEICMDSNRCIWFIEFSETEVRKAFFIRIGKMTMERQAWHFFAKVKKREVILHFIWVF